MVFIPTYLLCGFVMAPAPSHGSDITMSLACMFSSEEQKLSKINKQLNELEQSIRREWANLSGVNIKTFELTTRYFNFVFNCLKQSERVDPNYQTLKEYLQRVVDLSNGLESRFSFTNVNSISQAWDKSQVYMGQIELKLLTRP